MVNKKIKQTRAYQATRYQLPLSVWEEVARLAVQHRVDLNSISSVGLDSYEIGEPRTGLTICANANGAVFQGAK